MMLPPRLLCFVYIFITSTSAQSSDSLLLLSGSSLTGPITGSSKATSPTGSYASYSSTITAASTAISDGVTVIGTGTVNVTSYISLSSQIILQGSSTTNATNLSLIHISEPTRLGMISYAV